MTTPDEGWQARQDRLADERQREQTAAVVLAALIRTSADKLAKMSPLLMPTNEAELDALNEAVEAEVIRRSVALTDALRAALRGGS
jgi:hypothetical protein